MRGVVTAGDRRATIARGVRLSAQSIAVVPKSDTTRTGGGVDADVFGGATRDLIRDRRTIGRAIATGETFVDTSAIAAVRAALVTARYSGAGVLPASRVPGAHPRMAGIVIRAILYRLDTITVRRAREIVPDRHAGAVAVLEMVAVNGPGTTGCAFGNAIVSAAAILIVAATSAAAGGIEGRADAMAANIVTAAGVSIPAGAVQGNTRWHTRSLPIADHVMRGTDVDTHSVIEFLAKI